MEAHIHNIRILRPKSNDIEIPGPKNCDINSRRLNTMTSRNRQLNHYIVIPRHFFRGQKAATLRFQDWINTTLRFQDQKATASSLCRILTLMAPHRSAIFLLNKIMALIFQITNIQNKTLNYCVNGGLEWRHKVQTCLQGLFTVWN